MINMIPEIGHILLIMSTVFALLSATNHLIGSYRNNVYLSTLAINYFTHYLLPYLPHCVA